jgi:hypothetical protein
VVGRPADGQSRHRGNNGDNRSEHDHDEPGRPVFGLRRGLGDAHGVDESVRDEQEELHGAVQRFDVMVAGIGSSRGLLLLNRQGVGMHLYNQGLPERWQAHTL